MFCPFKLFPAAYAKGKTRADWIRKKIAGGFSCTDYTDLERDKYLESCENASPDSQER